MFSIFTGLFLLCLKINLKITTCLLMTSEHFSRSIYWKYFVIFCAFEFDQRVASVLKMKGSVGPLNLPKIPAKQFLVSKECCCNEPMRQACLATVWVPAFSSPQGKVQTETPYKLNRDFEGTLKRWNYLHLVLCSLKKLSVCRVSYIGSPASRLGRLFSAFENCSYFPGIIPLHLHANAQW